MSIDTGSTISYNALFPVAGIDQSSKGLRDNFAIIKTAIERLQSAGSTANSLFDITTTQNSDGSIQYNVGFRNNAFRLPIGDPTIAATVGMLRYASSTLQVFNGTAWVALNAQSYQSIIDALGFQPAPLNSAALTGVPTAPTAAAGTNTTQIATTAFVRGEIAGLVGGTTAALDSIYELANAIGNDANFAANITNQIASKAPLIHSHSEYIGTITGNSGSQIGGNLKIAGLGGITTALANNELTISLTPSASTHGSLGGGNLHANATTTTAGFMSAADKAKLDTIGGTGLAFSRMIVQNAQGLNIRDASSYNDAFVFKSSGPITLETDTKDMTIGFAPSDASHGQRAGGNLHPNALPNGTAGFMSGTDKAKLDALTFNTATTTQYGYMSAADKIKLNALGGPSLTNAFTKVVTPNGEFNAEGTDTLRIEGAAGIAVTPFSSASEKTIYITLTHIGSQTVGDVISTVVNYNTGNDRNADPVVAPTIANDGTAIDHTINANGSADISFEWSYAGAEDAIDGFIVYVRKSNLSTPYTLLTAPSEEQVIIATAQKRAAIVYGVSPTEYYTFYVQAYRMVDKDINADGIMKSVAVKSSATGENPYRPSENVAFAGDVTGSIAGTPVSTVRDSAIEAWGKFTGAGATLPAGNVEFNFAASGEKGGSATNALNLGDMTAEQINESVINFTERNDRNASPVVAPVIPTDGTAVDHTVNKDGSANISYEWNWAGDNADIDGFIVYVYQSNSNAPYSLGTTPSAEVAYYVTPEKRAFIMSGVPADLYYTFYVEAYRVVDPDISASGYIRSEAVKGLRAEENPYRPASAPVFLGDIQGTIDGKVAATVANAATNAWNKFSGTNNNLPAGAVDFNFAASGSKGGAATNTEYVGNQPASSIQESVINFNDRNDRDASPIVNPVVLTDGTAVDHTLNTDGSANISFEWTWSGNNADIDGFIVYIYQSTSSAAYVLGTYPTMETVYYVSPDRRAIILSGVPVDQYYTFYVMAYRIVDPDIEADGDLRSAAVKSTRSEENPYRPATAPVFNGDIKGTIDGKNANEVSTAALNAWGKFNGVNNTLPAGAVEFNFAASGSKGGAANNTNNVGTQTATTVQQSVINFNDRNDRNASPIAAPVILTDGTAVDHTISTDGSANISFEWTWSGSNADIDGFIVYLYQSTSNAAYVKGSNTGAEAVYYLTPEKRAFITYGVPANQYYTFFVEAYRIVDTDVSATGYVRSAIVKSTLAEENPYRPSATVAFNGDVTGSVAGTPATTVKENAVNAWSKFSGTGNTIPAGNVEFNFAASGSKGGSATNTDNVGNQSAVTVQESVINFNDRNDRDGSPIISPIVPSDGTAVDHTLNTDGSANISFEWTWAGSNNDIDGFIVFIYQSTSSSAYTLGTQAAAEMVYYVTPEKRGFIMYGVPANQYYTFFVCAYRVVDADIAASGFIRSSTVKSSRGEENPYRPSSTVAFTGDVTGTVAGTAAGTVRDNALSAWGKFTGSGNTLPSGNVDFTFAGSATKGGSAYNTVKVGDVDASKIQATILNFDTRNDRNGSPIPVPVVAGDGTAVDHTLNANGSANISFEWTWGGDPSTIDGFILYVICNDSSLAYALGQNPALELVYYVPPDRRALIIQGVPPERFYTFYVQAYRIVDADIEADGVMQSAAVKSQRGEENPYRPETAPVFHGDIAGTIAGTAVTTVLDDINSAVGRISVVEQTMGNIGDRTAEAFWKLETNAGGGSTAFISARSVNNDGSINSNVSIGAREFHVFNPNGSTWNKVLSVENNEVRIYGKLTADSIETNMIKVGAVTTGSIAGGAIGATQALSAVDAYVPANGTIDCLTTGWITIGDGVDGSAVVSVDFTLDTTIQYDASARIYLYVDTGNGYQLKTQQTLGITTDNGNTYSRVGGTISTMVEGAQVRVLMRAISGAFITKAVARNFYVRDIMLTLLGTKR